MASAASFAVALGSSALGAVGAVGLLPGVIAATAASVIAAKAVTFGLADAWRATGQAATGGGGKAVNTAKAVAAAQREVRTATQALADAQRAAQTTQEAVTRARMEEAERLEDLSRAVRGAKLDEVAAARAVQKAELDLVAARRTGKSGDITDANIAYEQAKQTLEDVRDRVDDLGKEQEEGAKKGVEGSDAVKSALQQQQDAQRAVTQAAERLADAQDAVREASQSAASGGINPAAAALAKLSPNARAAVLTLRSLAPAWASAARAGQNNAFAGTSKILRDLSGTYLPVATTFFGRMGTSINGAVKQAAGLAQTKRFVGDVNTVTGNTATAFDRVMRAVRPIINGLMQWAAVGTSFLPGLAGDSLSIAQRFERWSVAMRGSGQASTWIGTAIGNLKQMGAIARDVVMTVVGIFRAGDDGGSTLTNLTQGAAAMRKWVESGPGQEKLAGIFKTLRGIIAGIADGFANADGPSGAFFDTLSVGGIVMKFAADNLDTVATLLPYLAVGFVLVKTAQLASNVASVAAIPIQIAQVAVNRRLATSIAAQTAAMTGNKVATVAGTIATGANTAATVAGDVATKRSTISMIASKVAMVATSAATKAWAAAQWLINAAMYANPVGLIIAGVLLLIGVIILIATKTTWFQTAWKYAWGWIKSAALAVGRWFRDTLWKDWIVGTFNGIVAKGKQAVDWFLSMPGRIKKGLLRVSDIISAPFRAAFNWIARGWNNSVGKLSFTLPSWVPGIGGQGFHLPKLPMLADGGIVRARRGGTLAVVGEGGQDEAVIPLNRLGGMAGGRSGGGVLRIEVVGERETVAQFRRMIKQYNLLEA